MLARALTDNVNTIKLILQWDMLLIQTHWINDNLSRLWQPEDMPDFYLQVIALAGLQAFAFPLFSCLLSNAMCAHTAKHRVLRWTSKAIQCWAIPLFIKPHWHVSRPSPMQLLRLGRKWNAAFVEHALTIRQLRCSLHIYIAIGCISWEPCTSHEIVRARWPEWASCIGATVCQQLSILSMLSRCGTGGLLDHLSTLQGFLNADFLSVSLAGLVSCFIYHSLCMPQMTLLGNARWCNSKNPAPTTVIMAVHVHVAAAGITPQWTLCYNQQLVYCTQSTCTRFRKAYISAACKFSSYEEKFSLYEEKSSSMRYWSTDFWSPNPSWWGLVTAL